MMMVSERLKVSGEGHRKQMENITINACDFEAWDSHNLTDEFDWDLAVFCNQTEWADDTTEGEWFIADHDRMVIYYGSFGNYNSPGSSHDTYAVIFDNRNAFDDELKTWESYPEYLESEEVQP